MGRWKANNDGSAYYDQNDSGPDQVQGMGGAPSQGQSGGSSSGPDTSGSTPGWGPIKISGTYQPHPSSPGDFWSHIGQMPGQGGGSVQGPSGPFSGGSEGPGGISGRGQGPGWTPIQAGVPGGGAVWGPGGQPPGIGTTGFNPSIPMLGQPQNGAGTSTPNPGEDYQGMFSRFLNDYHAPDRDDVMSNIIRNDPNPQFMHLQNGNFGDPGMQPTPITPHGFPTGQGRGWGGLGSILGGPKESGLLQQLVERLRAQQPLGSPGNPRPGQMVPNGWGGMKPYNPNDTAIS